ncbi:MAG: GDSL-type esterase/lipase family protein [Actinomycetota bacterium]|nr:GDSL-type esterase/lipase family protein [Actinomycetota bacterium]
MAVALVVLTVAGIGVAAVVSGRPGHAAGVPLPSSMASAGDSITRAFDVNGSRFLADSLPASWSTGSDVTVDSHYRRIRRANPAIGSNAFNDAHTGAAMADLDGQLKVAAGQGVQYLTILIGANDLCTPTAAAMTPTATFGAEFDQALSDFFAADPQARVFVASIPDIFQLWSTMHTDLRAQATWALARICQSMLSLSGTDADRRLVVAREVLDNAALGAVCGRYRNCRWDGNAVYRARFSAAEVSDLDYFHPSVAGQAALAATTWAAGYWPGVG